MQSLMDYVGSNGSTSITIPTAVTAELYHINGRILLHTK